MKKVKFLYLLETLNKRNPNQFIMQDIIETLHKIAVTYLCVNYKKVRRILSKEGITIEDIAIDSIAPLFLKDSNGYFYVLKDAFEQWRPIPRSEEDILFILNKIVAKRVEQHTILLLKEAEPIFSKILDSIYYLIKKNGYIKKYFLGLSYIVEENNTEIIGETIDEIAFNNLPLNLFINKKESLSNIFYYLKNETGFFPAIPINILIRRLEQINSSDFSATNYSQYFYENYDIDELLKTCFRETEIKLHETYVSKGKLSYADAECIKAALEDISYDLKQGGITGSFFEYLKFHMINLTKNEYMTHYNHILQYLYKVMKNNISQMLNS